MPLFEHMPYTNFQNVNFDWIMKTLKEHTDDLTALRTDVSEIQNTISVIEGDITNIKTDITNIYEQIGEIDIEALEGRVDVLEASDRTQNTEIASIKARLTTAEGNIQDNAEDIEANDASSRGRDDALSARIANLERATIHDIYNYFSESNQLLFGSDLRHMSPVLDADGYPIVAWGNRTNASQAGTPETRSFKFVEGGMVADTSRASYDYYQVGQFTNGLGINGAYTVTLALVNADDATPTWYTHTFTASNEAWTIAPNCIIRIRKFYNWNDESTDHIVTVAFMGTAANWNTFLGNSKISFIFIENGTGSVDTSVTAKPPYNMKDREFFVETETPTPSLPETVITGQVTEDATVTYYDLVGEPQTITSQIIMTANLKRYGKVVDGYLQIRMNLRNNVSDVLARGAQFTLTGLAMTYDGGVNAPMPDTTSPLRGVANDSRYYEWDYNNTQNVYLFVNISNDGTWNLKMLSGGMRNYTGSADTYTDFRIPIHYLAA